MYDVRHTIPTSAVAAELSSMEATLMAQAIHHRTAYHRESGMNRPHEMNAKHRVRGRDLSPPMMREIQEHQSSLRLSSILQSCPPSTVYRLRGVDVMNFLLICRYRQADVCNAVCLVLC